MIGYFCTFSPRYFMQKFRRLIQEYLGIIVLLIVVAFTLALGYFLLFCVDCCGYEITHSWYEYLTGRV